MWWLGARRLFLIWSPLLIKGCFNNVILHNRVLLTSIFTTLRSGRMVRTLFWGYIIVFSVWQICILCNSLTVYNYPLSSLSLSLSLSLSSLSCSCNVQLSMKVKAWNQFSVCSVQQETFLKWILHSPGTASRSNLSCHQSVISHAISLHIFEGNESLTLKVLVVTIDALGHFETG